MRHVDVSRRSVLLGAGALVLAGCSTEPDRPAPVVTEAPIEDRLAALERRYDAFIGVSAVDADSGRSVTHRADDTFAMCSTFKAYASARVLQKARLGQLHLTDAVSIEPDDLVANSPVTQTRVGSTMTLAELCEAALQRSDNTAGNWLLRVIGGPSAVTAFARSIGDDRSRLDRWETALNSAIPGDPRDTSSPSALGGGFRRLLTGDALAPGDRDLLEHWMRGNQTSSLRAGLPPQWTSADKTGSGDFGSTNDVGVVYGPDGRRAVLAVMTRSQTNDPNAEGLRPLIGELTALLVPHLTAS